LEEKWKQVSDAKANSKETTRKTKFYVKIILKWVLKIGWGGTWINLAQNVVQWRELVNMSMNFQPSQNAG
jgi:hypothetical protein